MSEENIKWLILGPFILVVFVCMILPALAVICSIGAGGGMLYGIGCSTYNFIQACKEELPNRR